jgi:hypothetical protein
MREHDGYEDLRVLGRRSVMPYVHGESCCIAVYAVQL